MKNKLIHIIGFLALLLLLGPAMLEAQDRPSSRDLSAAIRAAIAESLADSLPAMETRLEGILADSVEAMEARLTAAFGDSARAAVALALADSLPAMQARLSAILADSLVVMEGRLAAALGDTARAVVNAALADSLPVMEARLDATLADSAAAIEARLNAALVDSVLSVVSATLADSLPVIEARLQAWLQASVDTTGIGRLTARVEADSAALVVEIATRAAADDSMQYFWAEAADTTSPGLAYRPDSTGVWIRTDTSTSTKGKAFAVDSVAQGQTCRFQFAGTLVTTRWAALGFQPGDEVVNDSLVAGGISVSDPNRNQLKKMQPYGDVYRVSGDTVWINVKFGESWVWEAIP